MGLIIMLDLLLCILVYPFVILGLLPLYFYRLLLTLLAKVIHPDLKPLSTCDQFMAWDLLIPKREGKRLVYSVGCSVRVNGRITLEALKAKLSKKILSAVDEAGEKMYPKLFEYLTLFGGYAFRKPAPTTDVNFHVRQVELGGRDLNSFQAEWIGLSFPEKTSAWEMVLLPIGDGSETILLFKIHHSMADAYSLLHIFNTLMDNSVPTLPNEPEDSTWQKILQGIQCPRKMMVYSLGVLRSRKALSSFSSDNRELQCFSSSTALYLSDFKKIQRKTGTAYTPLTLALFGGVLARILSEKETSMTDKEKLIKDPKRSTYVQLSFPRPNHPVSKMCNHWTSGGVRVPISPMRPLDRLREIEIDYKAFLDSGMDKIMCRFMFPAGGLLPTRFFPKFFEATRLINGLRTIFTSASGYNDGFYELDGNPIISFSPVLGFIGTTPILTGIGLSYNDRYEVNLIATSEIAKDQETMDTIVNNYFAEEVEALLEQVNSKK